MKIVVLDGYTLNPGDLSYAPFEEFGEVVVYDRTPPQEVASRSQGAEIVLTNKALLHGSVISKLPALKYIGVMATGYNVVDLDVATRQGIVVTNVPDYGTVSVAQFTFALLLELCHSVQRHSDVVRQGAWGRSADFTFTIAPLVELAGKTMGIVGFGSIGQQVARLAVAFGMKVLVHSRTERVIRGLEGVEYVRLEELLCSSDVVTLHCPLNEQTQGLIRRETLEQMKPNAFLLNTARGGLVMEQDLAEALTAHRIAGAALDVLTVEPPVSGSPLLTVPTCIITPHIAWATKESRSRLMDIAVGNVRSFLLGAPRNVVNPRLGRG